MQITVTRQDTRRYATTVTRDDGVTLSVPGYGFMHAMPHDLGHYVVEATLPLRHGFWDCVAEGAVFRGMAVLSGRRKPHADERSRALMKNHADRLNEAETLVGAFEHIVDNDLDRKPGDAERLIRKHVAGFRNGLVLPDRNGLLAISAAWRDMLARWGALPIGQALELPWCLPRQNRRHA